MINKENITGLAKKVLDDCVKRPVKTAVCAGLIGLTGLTLAKDNVHFVPIGTIEFNAPQKNQYVWGLVPIARTKGESQAKMKNFGVVGGNSVGDSSSVGDMSAYGLLIGGNFVGDSSSVGDMSAYGLLTGGNSVGNKTRINGNVNSRGILSETPSGVSPLTRIEEHRDYVHSTKKTDEQ